MTNTARQSMPAMGEYGSPRFARDDEKRYFGNFQRPKGTGNYKNTIHSLTSLRLPRRIRHCEELRRRGNRNDEYSAAIQGCALRAMDRHGLRPRDDERYFGDFHVPK